MSFLDSIIQEEVSKKRKALEAASKESDPGKKVKYVSRAELERIREEEYRRKEEDREEKERQRKARLAEEETKRRDLARQNAMTDEGSKDKETEQVIEAFNISREECVRRLRAMGQPIRLFAETDKQCKVRLRALELMNEEAGEQGRNEFMKTLEEMETNMRLDDLKQKGGVSEEKKVKKPTLDVEPIQLELISTDIDRLYSQIHVYFTHTLGEWEEYMADRPEEEKRTGSGKKAAVLQKQAAEYIKPLMRQLKNKSLEPDVLARVAEIAQRMQVRRYRDAQDAYLQLSIGNAPWPIGVTMVGIHERSAREKISSSQVAHVLNDETSRKWIQSVKRLMTFAQTKYPPYTLSQIS